MNRIDRDAFKRAIESCRNRKDDPGRREQIDSKLAEEPWDEVGRFAAYSCQSRNLNLKPWQIPPCWIRDVEAVLAAGDDDMHGRRAAAKLLKRMLDAGLSRYEPDPLAALDARSAVRVVKTAPPEPPAA
jgi:hypothetical protein